VNQIKRWNGLKSNNIRVGQRLIIYRGGKAPATASSAPAGKQSGTQTAAAKPVMSASGDYLTYTVQSGDSFYLIAKRYPGISAQNIMDYNGLDSSKLRPGMKIKIPVIK
jgi:membrane-bound lytic murein transglycosylase D